jgi:hypothetical protein
MDGVLLEVCSRKKCVMLEFSLLQLVTLKPEVVNIPEVQPTQSLPCSFHIPATRHSIAIVCQAPTKCDLLLITVMMHPWVLQGFLICSATSWMLALILM